MTRVTRSPDAAAPGGPRAPAGVTVKAIASAVALSEPTVSQVLNGKGRISASTRQRVMQAAEAMGYRPNAAARAVATRKTRQVGVLVLNDAADTDSFPHTYLTILGMNMALESAGYVLCMVRIGDVEETTHGHSRVFREHVLDGLIVTTNLPDRLARQVERIVPACVWADANHWRETGCVRRDEFGVGQTAARAAIEAGYRKFVYLTEVMDAGGLPSHYSHVDRGRGVAAVCRAAGLPLGVLRHSWDWTPTFADALGRRLAPDVAVIATDAFRAELVQQAAALNRRLIGVDFGLVCCDNAGGVTQTWPDLCGLEFDRVALGRRSARMLLEMLETNTAPKSEVLTDISPWHPGHSLGHPTKRREAGGSARTIKTGR